MAESLINSALVLVGRLAGVASIARMPEGFSSDGHEEAFILTLRPGLPLEYPTGAARICRESSRLRKPGFRKACAAHERGSFHASIHDLSWPLRENAGLLS